MRHRHHHHLLHRKIKITPHLLLDVDPPSVHSQPPLSFEVALRQLQTALTNNMLMSQLRSLLPTWAGGSLVNHQIVREIALQVSRGSLALKTERSPTDLNWDDVLDDIKRFEGVVPHMYLDTVGLVTVGAGQMLPSASAAEKLPFVVRSTGSPATSTEISADFHAVAAQPAGLFWRKYKTTLDLPEATAYKLALAYARQGNDEIAGAYKGYKKYPAEVKRVLIDMRYNLGPTRFAKYKHLKKDLELAQETSSSDAWKRAAKETHRRGIQDDRNDWARDMILKGAGLNR